MIGIESATVIGIGEILGIITSVVSIVITYVIERKALVRWRMGLWWALLFLWIGIIFIIIGLVSPVFSSYDGTLLVLFGVIVWIIGIMRLIILFRHICLLETIPFSKPNLSNLENCKFDKFESCFREESLDSAIKEAKKRENGELYFPVILAADESWRPWIIAQKFTKDALEKGAGVIYFTFTRPASQIKNQLGVDNKIINSKNLIFIDCMTKLSVNNKKDEPANGIFYADPRNPHDMNEKYKNALSFLLYTTKPKYIPEKFFNFFPKIFNYKCPSQCKRMCVVYDALSDFLFFTDKEIATQYLRHNMNWEEEKNVHSLYIFRLGTLEKLLEEYILWFANTVISLETEDEKPMMKIRGLFRGPKLYKINYDLQVMPK